MCIRDSPNTEVAYMGCRTRVMANVHEMCIRDRFRSAPPAFGAGGLSPGQKTGRLRPAHLRPGDPGRPRRWLGLRVQRLGALFLYPSRSQGRADQKHAIRGNRCPFKPHQCAAGGIHPRHCPFDPPFGGRRHQNPPIHRRRYVIWNCF